MGYMTSTVALTDVLWGLVFLTGLSVPMALLLLMRVGVVAAVPAWRWMLAGSGTRLLASTWVLVLPWLTTVARPQALWLVSDVALWMGVACLHAALRQVLGQGMTRLSWVASGMVLGLSLTVGALLADAGPSVAGLMLNGSSSLVLVWLAGVAYYGLPPQHDFRWVLALLALLAASGIGLVLSDVLPEPVSRSLSWLALWPLSLGMLVLTADQMQRAGLQRRDLDTLTEVLSRAPMIDRIQQEIARMRRKGGTFVLVFFRVEGMKIINEQHGHAMGDAVLADCAERIRTAVRREDVVGRVGDQQFAALLLDTNNGFAVHVVQRLQEGLRGEGVGYVCSAGMTERREDDLVVDPVMERAQTALDHARASQPGSVHVVA
jgi:diguanylate cyclase (GGDEF)-like protein